ncbi:MAG: hypothetical protein IPM16_13950 [Chloroflexi bacterium]|nr:hypothetical protein [Chloroflexota bacterium]
MSRYRAALGLFVVVISLVLVGSFAAAGAEDSVPLIHNGGFDVTVDRDLDPWVVVNGTKDKVVCGSKAPPNTSGGCAFRFKGSANESAKLVQLADAGILSAANGLLVTKSGQVSFSYSVWSDLIISSLKAKLVIVYTPLGGVETKEKLTDTFTGTTDAGRDVIWAAEGPAEMLDIPKDATLSKVKVLFANKSPFGKLHVDGIIAILIGL